jgi:hypothetical protein
MKKEEELKELLNELAQKTTEPVRPGLAADIKHQIPYRLLHHRGGIDTINIIIDLRINKLAAAAAIIMTIIFCAAFLGGRDSTGGNVLKDSMLLIKYWGGVAENSVSTGRLKYEHLLDRGEDVVWYGDLLNPKDRNAVLMQRKLPDGKYEVMFVNGHQKQVTADELIKLLSEMLHKNNK